MIIYRTGHKALERIAPEPLEIVEPAVKYESVRMPYGTAFGSCRSAQVIPVRFRSEMGGYADAMFLDSHSPIAGNRELWGFPQTLATPSLNVERDTRVGALDSGPIRVAIGTVGSSTRHCPRGACTDRAAVALCPHALVPVAGQSVRKMISCVYRIADLALDLGQGHARLSRLNGPPLESG